MEIRKKGRGMAPGGFGEVDFTEVRSGRYGYKYLLVFVDTIMDGLRLSKLKEKQLRLLSRNCLKKLFLDSEFQLP